MKQITLEQRRIITALLLILPAMVLIIIFKILPIFEAFRFSFYDYNILKPDEKTFIGFSNYIEAFTKDPYFYNSVKVTFLFAVLKIVLQIIPALLIALLLTKRQTGIGFLRSVILIPTVTSLVVVSVIWNFLYDPNNGLINSFLSFLGLPVQPFLTSPDQALFSLLGMMIWKDMGFVTILFLAGLQDIPDVFHEAAIVDGASNVQRFFKITLPLLKRTTLFVVVIMTIWSFQVFTPIYVTTKGGPADSTNTLVYYLFEKGFIYMEMGYAFALSTILFITILIIGLIQRKFLSADFEY
jgi:ABC-type sugar transport system permease subunit